jgi:hypothetical protein
MQYFLGGVAPMKMKRMAGVSGAVKASIKLKRGL